MVANRTRENRPFGVKRGASGNMAMAELCTHPAYRKSGHGNPPPTVNAPEFYPNLCAFES